VASGCSHLHNIIAVFKTSLSFQESFVEWRKENRAEILAVSTDSASSPRAPQNMNEGAAAELPVEVMHHIISYVSDPVPLIHLAATCTELLEFVATSEELWDRLFKIR